MSRIGKQPVAIPKGVEVKESNGTLSVKGPKGEMTLDVHPDMSLVVEESELRVERPSDQKEHRALHGLTQIGLQREGIWKLKTWEVVQVLAHFRHAGGVVGVAAPQDRVVASPGGLDGEGRSPGTGPQHADFHGSGAWAGRRPAPAAPQALPAA